jgi:zinc transport system permease protein
VREFLQLLLDPDAGFIRTAFFAGIAASVAFAVTGTYVVVRRSASIAGAIAHSVLGGIGLAVYAQHVLGWEWCTPLRGALAAAVASALLVGAVTARSDEREDSALAAIWAGGMAIGLLFIYLARNHTTSIDPMSYLVGDILLVSKSDLRTVLALDAVVVAAAFHLNHKIAAVCFDEEFATLRGVHSRAYYLGLLVLTGLSIVFLSRLVGIIMVIALLVIPAAIASRFARRLWQMMALSALVCAAFTTAGLALSVNHDVPSGPAIILVASSAYLLAFVPVGKRG